ncbi:MAG: cyclic nucleotide-binding domain-containing protein, partial [Phaeodactylibacter sp.]|nr:cyclic nucleotide-binding domain-containing protein [Phaeodactylibacter sp.]
MATETTARFLQDYPPFIYLPKIDLEELAGQAIREEVAEGGFLFEEGGEVQPFIYVLRKGHFEIMKKFEDSTQVIDVLKKGDVLGARAILTHKPYLASARATRKSVLIKIP